MRESLRVRLVLWYALVLTLVVVLYGGAVVYQSWRTMTTAVDLELDEYAREVSAALKPVEGGRFDLEIPSDAASDFFGPERRAYYVIWSPTGELVDQSAPELKVGLPGTTAAGRRELSMPAAGGATVLVGRDIADLVGEQRGLFWNVAARRPCDACGGRSSAGGSSQAARWHRSSGSAGPRRRCRRAI